MLRDKAMQIARTIALRLNEVRLQQAIREAHRARLDFLRQDLFDGDCERCVRKVQAAEARAAALEVRLAGLRGPASSRVRQPTH